MYTVYILKSETNKLYIGQTKNIEKRLNEHNSGLATYTKRCTSWRLIYSEKYKTRSEAMRREKELKTGKYRKWLKKII